MKKYQSTQIREGFKIGAIIPQTFGATLHGEDAQDLLQVEAGHAEVTE